MKTQRKATTAAMDRKEAKERDSRLSPDGKWRSFPKVPHLLQYEPTAMYYARVKVCGKLVRRRLKTDVYSKALLRLNDFLNQQRSAPPRSVNAPITFADARVRFEQALKARHETVAVLMWYS